MLATAAQTAGPAELAEISFFQKSIFFKSNFLYSIFLNSTSNTRQFSLKLKKKTSKFVIWTVYLSEITNSDKLKKNKVQLIL